MPQDEAVFDVAILGAGPAGSAAAIELARAGRHTLLIEKKQFPREKVCGGCLSGPATARLRQLLRTDSTTCVGPASSRSDLQALGPPLNADRPLPGVDVTQATFVIGSYRLTCHPNGLTRMVPRSVLDACLADAAAVAGAQVHYGKSASLVRGDAGWDVMIGNDRIHAETILIACGLSGLPRQLGIQARAVRRRMIGQMWFQPAEPPLPPVGSVELHWLRGGYVGLATPDADRCVVAVAVDASRYSTGNLFDGLRRCNPKAAVWRMLPPDAPRRYNAIGTAGFPWLPDRLGVDNVLLIGDAAGFEEPFSGEGIGQAMRSAACAAQAILGDVDPLPRYTALMEHHHRAVMRRTRWVRRLLDLSLIHYLAEKRPVLPRGLLSRPIGLIHVKGAL